MHDSAEPRHNRPTRVARLHNQLHRYKKLLQRRWWVLPLTMALGLGVQGWRTYRQPPAYISVGKMIVSIRVQTKMGTSYLENPIDFLGTQRRLMTSSTVLNRAADRVRALKPKLAPVPVQVQTAISPKTSIFEWQVVGGEPEYVTAYLDAAMDEFVQLKKDMRSDTSRVTLQSLDDQIRKSVEELKGYETELLNFQASNSVVLLEEQGKEANGLLGQLSTRLSGLRIDYELLDLLTLDQNIERQQKDYASGNNNNNPSTPDNLLHSDYLRARQEIELKKAEMKDWSEFLKPKHPRMIAYAEDIAHREKLLEIYKEQSKEQLSSRRDRIGLEITNLVREVAELEVKSLDISKKTAAYERIRSAKQRAQLLYEQLLSTMQALSVDKDINPESINVLERARPAVEARPNPARALIIGGVLGLLVGLGLLLVVDRFDDRPFSFTDLTDMFDEPVLGQIPLEKSRGRSGVPIIHGDDDRHALLEAYRNLRSSLLYMATEGKRPKTLVVTSAIPSDGKSLTTSNLAITMALAGARVLLVDADLRRGQLHSKFNVASSTPGFTEVLSGFPWEQAVQPTATPNLSLLPRGNLARNPGELFLSQRARDLLKEFSAQFDYVIIDTAPVMAADDVTSLAPHVEGVVFVIRAGYTSGRVARAALDLLYQREVDVLGLVFNGVETNASEYYYYKYKDYYAEYKGA